MTISSGVALRAIHWSRTWWYRLPPRSSIHRTQGLGYDVALLQEGVAGDVVRNVAGADLRGRVGLLVVEHTATSDDPGAFEIPLASAMRAGARSDREHDVVAQV
ncbi:MAG TPA: hypothetical protein VFV66_36230 [Nonomuraea sp.]|nr:hypothetical protein [Nonomuraea sp.]